MKLFPLLVNHRGQPLTPNRLAGPLATYARSLAELCDGLARSTSDPRWREIATAADRFATALRTLS
jgi:hypothetical protein